MEIEVDRFYPGYTLVEIVACKFMDQFGLNLDLVSSEP